MKKLIYLLGFLLLLSCDRDDKPIPSGTDLSIISQQQSPFGISSVDVKLKKVYFNNSLIAEFVYDGDQLQQFKGYGQGQSEKQFASGIFKRREKLLQSYEFIMASVEVEGGWISGDLKPAYTLNFSLPENGLIRDLEQRIFNYSSSVSLPKSFHFDKDGYVTQLLNSYSGAEAMKIFERNQEHNIIRSYFSDFDKSNRFLDAEYQYDNHPNPYFEIGMDAKGLFSIHSLNPNNILKEIGYNGGSPYSVDYTYEYLPNGYPSRVTLKSTGSLWFNGIYTFEY